MALLNPSITVKETVLQKNIFTSTVLKGLGQIIRNLTLRLNR